MHDISKVVAVGALICVVGVAQRAEAAFCIRITEPGINLRICDNGVGDLDPSVCVILVNFSTPTYASVVVTAIQFKPVATAPEIVLTVSYVASGAAGATRIAVTNTDFRGNPGAIHASTGGNQASGVTATWSTSLDEGNAEFGVGSAGVLSLGPVAGAQGLEGTKGGYGRDNPFSLSGVVTLLSSGGNRGADGSSNNSLQAIPEPTTLAIWSLLGGVGLVAGWRKRRNRKAAW